MVQLLLERDELARLHEPAAQVIGEREHEPSRPLGLGADERRDRVQRVEDEVRLHLRLQRGRRRGRQLGQLQLRRELLAERLERLDRGLVERRAAGRERDDGAGRAVVQPQRHDGRRAERAGGMAALDAQPERREQRPVLRQRLVHRADRLIARRMVVGARADEGEHLVRVGDGDRAVAELLEQLVGDRARRALGQAAPQLGQRRLRATRGPAPGASGGARGA